MVLTAAEIGVATGAAMPMTSATVVLAAIQTLPELSMARSVALGRGEKPLLPESEAPEPVRA